MKPLATISFALALLLTGCAAVAPPPDEAALDTVAFPVEAYREAQAEGRAVYWLQPEESSLRIYVFRAGPLAEAAGHNHVMVAERFRGAAAWPEGEPEEARLNLVVPVDGLEVDPAVVREALGGAFSSHVKPEDAQGTRSNMLSPAILDAAHYPAIGVRLVEVEGELPRPILTLAVTLHGVTREVTVPAKVSISAERLVAEGMLVLRQTRFDIEPFSALGGALRVADPVVVEFHLVGEETPPAGD